MNNYIHNPRRKYDNLKVNIKSFLRVFYEISTRYQQNVDILCFLWIFPQSSWKWCVNYRRHLCKCCRNSKNTSTNFPRNVSNRRFGIVGRKKSMVYCIYKSRREHIQVIAKRKNGTNCTDFTMQHMPLSLRCSS